MRITYHLFYDRRTLRYPVNYSCIKGYGLMNWN